jgi:hypothetical protein
MPTIKLGPLGILKLTRTRQHTAHLSESTTRNESCELDAKTREAPRPYSDCNPSTTSAVDEKAIEEEDRSLHHQTHDQCLVGQSSCAFISSKSWPSRWMPTSICSTTHLVTFLHLIIMQPLPYSLTKSVSGFVSLPTWCTETVAAQAQDKWK